MEWKEKYMREHERLMKSKKECKDLQYIVEIQANMLAEYDEKEYRLTANEYQELAARTINTEIARAQQALHAVFGMASEVGELQGMYQKYYQGHELDREHMKKELGDILWMVAEYCTALGWTLEDIMLLNIEKLEERYPDGFEADRSLHRKAGDI